MNEPIEHAQKSTGRVTAKMVLACIKAGSESLCLHGAACFDRASYSDAFTFTLTATKKSRLPRDANGGPDYSVRPVETATKIEVPGYVSNGHTSTRETRKSSDPSFGDYVQYTEGYRPLKGYWSLSYGHGAGETLINILELLPRDAEIAFKVNLDAGTHEYLVRADCKMNRDTEEGLHADHLMLVATWTVRGKKVTREFFLGAQIIPHNTARFGSPGSRF